jgi:hypothetical protein
MADAVLERKESSDEGTFGHFSTKAFWCYSGELPWRGNLASISCVPAGIYTAAFTYSPRFHRTLYLLISVLNRSGIRVHPANLMGNVELGYKSQLNGCIALGERLGWIGGQKALVMSAPAVRRAEAAFGGRPFTLEIISC